MSVYVCWVVRMQHWLPATINTILSSPNGCAASVIKRFVLCWRACRSIIELARKRGYTVEEVPVSVHEAMEADELFTTGTAVVGLMKGMYDPAC